MIGAPGEVGFEHIVELGLAADHARVDTGHGLLAREPGALLAEALFGADQAHQVGAVGLVEHREPSRQAGGLAKVAQNAVGSGVKRATPDLAGTTIGRRSSNPAEHLRRRPSSERQQQDSSWVSAVGDDPAHPSYECSLSCRCQRQPLPATVNPCDRPQPAVVRSALGTSAEQYGQGVTPPPKLSH